MAKRTNVWNKEKLERYLKEGRGKGEGKDYMPWIKIQDFPSMGRATRLLGNKTRRVHHLFTDLQTKCLYIWDWDKDVIDIREHYPLLDLEDVIDTSDLNLELFIDKNTGEKYIITTTFLLTVKLDNDNIKYFARSVKNKNNLTKKTTVEKLEMERRFWKEKGIHWAIVTEDNINQVKVRNIEWLHGITKECKDYGLDSKEIIKLCEELSEYIIDKKIAIRRVLKNFDNMKDLVPGTGILIFKYLIISGLVKVDLNKEIDLGLSLEKLVQEEKSC